LHGISLSIEGVGAARNAGQHQKAWRRQLNERPFFR
jgi:hypothetical protein